MANRSCSFCYRQEHLPRSLIKGPRDIRICSRCVLRCGELLKNPAGGDRIEEDIGSQAHKPKEIKAYLDQHIIGQEQAKKALAVAVYNHYKRIQELGFPAAPARAEQSVEELLQDLQRPGSEEQAKEPVAGTAEGDDAPQDPLAEVELHKGNILMVGPTGVGKTALAEAIAELLEVPFVVKDATTLTEAGYVGEDVESIIKALWEAADKNVERASQGIVVIDEVDKLARRGGANSNGRDVGGEGVQQALLKIMESSQVNIHPDNGRRPSKDLIQINTTNVLFIFCGAFVGVERLIQSRRSPGSIGFGQRQRRRDERESYNELIRDVSVQDIVKFGLIPEFVGRLPVLVHLESLDEEALVQILYRPKNSILRQYQTLLELDDVQLEFTEGAMRAIVRRALKRKSGARGLRSILEELMLEIMYELPDREDVIGCTITEAVVEEGADPVLTLRSQESA